MSLNSLQKPGVLLAVAILVLWLNFSAHILSTLPLKKFIDGEFPSERFVFSRLIHNIEHGVDSEGGFMLAYNHVDMLHKSVEREDYAVFKQRLENGEEEAEIYLSHYGLQDNLVNPLWTGLVALKAVILEKAREGSRWHARLQRLDYYYFNLISQTVIALINAVAIGLFMRWVAAQFSVRHAWIVLGLVLVSLPVLTFYGRSMWWMMWSWYLPMLLTLWGFYKCESVPGMLRTACIGVLAGGAVFTKTLMGYEFVSTVMVAAMVPLVFYAVLRGWGWCGWFKVSFVVGACCLAGALAAMAVHYMALEEYGVSALEVLRGRYEMRAHGGETLVRMEGEIPKSTKESVFAVIGGYLISGKELGLPQIIFIAPMLIWLLRLWKTSEKVTVTPFMKALAAAIGVSFLGAISMLVILKGHAYIHGYDVVVWAIPMNFFVLTFYAEYIITVYALNKAPNNGGQ